MIWYLYYLSIVYKDEISSQILCTIVLKIILTVLIFDAVLYYTVKKSSWSKQVGSSTKIIYISMNMEKSVRDFFYAEMLG